MTNISQMTFQIASYWKIFCRLIVISSFYRGLKPIQFISIQNSFIDSENDLHYSVVIMIVMASQISWAKKSRRRGFDAPSRSLWRHCNAVHSEWPSIPSRLWWLNPHWALGGRGRPLCPGQQVSFNWYSFGHFEWRHLVNQSDLKSQKA